MKKCPNCTYLWADEHSGPCTECGNPMADIPGNGGLNFAYARQVQAGAREGSMEQAMKRGEYSGVSVNDAILDKARALIVQKEEVIYEDDAA